MEYLVIGADGNEYGPVNIATLKQWVSENRIAQESSLKEFATGRVIQAGTVPGLFAAAMPPHMAAAANPNPYANPPASYPRQGYVPNYSQGNAGSSDVWWALGRSALALILFFVLGGLGLIVAIYGIVSAVRAQQAGHKLGVVAVVISVLTLIIIGIGWFFRLQSRAY